MKHTWMVKVIKFSKINIIVSYKAISIILTHFNSHPIIAVLTFDPDSSVVPTNPD